MKAFILLLPLLIMSCGTDGSDGSNGDDGQSCYITSKDDNGSTITCGDETYFIPNGSDGTNGTDGVNGDKGDKGDKGDDGANGKDFTPDPTQDWTRFFQLENGGFIELLELDDGRVQIYGTQSLHSINFDNAAAFHPSIPIGPHALKSGTSINGQYNATYSNATNDLEIDGGTGSISGSRKTVYNIYFDNDKLKIRLMVYDANGVTVQANRLISEL